MSALNSIVKVQNFNDNNNLKGLYDKFITLKAGSAASVLATVQALYNQVNPWTKSTDEATKTVAAAVVNVITGESGAFEVVNRATDVNPVTLGWKKFNSEDVIYPRNLNLPDGAAILDFAKNTNKFEYKQDGLTIGATPSIDVNTISFPASLYYWVESEAKATSDVTANFPTYDNWNDVASWGSEVTETTQKIAIKEKINYGVASLKLNVKCDGLTLPEYSTTAVANKINVPDNGYSVTGVLIGGQPDFVGYNFGQKADNKFETTIYDNDVDIKALANKFGEFNYTLVLPNANSSALTNEQKIVNIAIELVNDGDDFHGAGGQLIPHGGTFYLIGQLKPDEKNNPGNKFKYVFESDTQAEANVTIKTLAKAYNTIPDLRSTNLSFGLAVDLDWTPGIKFDVTIE